MPGFPEFIEGERLENTNWVNARNRGMPEELHMRVLRGRNFVFAVICLSILNKHFAGIVHTQQVLVDAQTQTNVFAAFNSCPNNSLVAIIRSKQS
ncbi:hypothetical protein EGT74_09640 [Chitinophaga lutea]|uniref:Uncharacterized protein n=1 Tax=Chitinophaga lutea TaxID=2488634 RepID=A0A3N4PY51_9BACT|nr:hypothetical protein EGT74_09640 [Chitinophaga lutea]